MIKVRQANDNDLSWLLDQLFEFSKFYGTKKNLFGSEQYAIDYVTKIVKEHFVLVSENENEKTGFIAGLILQHPFNPEIKLLQELWWWVKPEYRQGRSGYKLFKDFSDFGKKFCDWTVFALEENSPVNDKILLKNGFRHKETTYLRESN